MARVSNTLFPHLSVERNDAVEATLSHVSLYTLKPGLFRSHSSSGARNYHTCDRVCV